MTFTTIWRTGTPSIKKMRIFINLWNLLKHVLSWRASNKIVGHQTKHSKKNIVWTSKFENLSGSRKTWFFAVIYLGITKKMLFLILKLCKALRGRTVHFVHCMRIPQQGRSLCFSFVVSFSLIVLTNLNMFKDLSLEFRNKQTQNCAPIQCTVCLVMKYGSISICFDIDLIKFWCKQQGKVAIICPYNSTDYTFQSTSRVIVAC